MAGTFRRTIGLNAGKRRLSSTQRNVARGASSLGVLEPEFLDAALEILARHAEDRSRARLGHGQENLALLRRWALSVQLQNTTVKGSMEKKRLQTGWNDKNLEKLLDLF